MSSKLKLPDDLREAFLELASYLFTYKIEPSRAVKEDGEIAGYWQTYEWLDGLSDLAHECKRIADALEGQEFVTKSAWEKLNEQHSVALTRLAGFEAIRRPPSIVQLINSTFEEGGRQRPCVLVMFSDGSLYQLTGNGGAKWERVPMPNFDEPKP